MSQAFRHKEFAPLDRRIGLAGGHRFANVDAGELARVVQPGVGEVGHRLPIEAWELRARSVLSMTTRARLWVRSWIATPVGQCARRRTSRRRAPWGGPCHL